MSHLADNPPHPGAILGEDVVAALGLSLSEAAQRLGVSRTTLSRVIKGQSGISPKLAVRLERAGVSKARFWLDLQMRYDLATERKKPEPQVRSLGYVSEVK